MVGMYSCRRGIFRKGIRFYKIYGVGISFYLIFSENFLNEPHACNVSSWRPLCKLDLKVSQTIPKAK
jgi:hypothetical protein